VLLPTLQERAWYPVGDLIFLAGHHYDPARGRLDVEYTLVRDGRLEKRAMSARIHSCREVCRLFEEAGFTDLRGYGTLAQEPFRLGSQRLLLVGTRDGDARAPKT
jgi:hypothetical protein